MQPVPVVGLLTHQPDTIADTLLADGQAGTATADVAVPVAGWAQFGIFPGTKDFIPAAFTVLACRAVPVLLDAVAIEGGEGLAIKAAAADFHRLFCLAISIIRWACRSSQTI